MADLLTTIRAEIDARLSELRPAIAEYERLSTATEALAAKGRAAPRPATRAAPQPDAPARVPAKTKARPKAARRARKRERTAQSEKAMAQIRKSLAAQPDLTIRQTEVTTTTNGENNGTQAFAALNEALADVPPARIAGSTPRH